MKKNRFNLIFPALLILAALAIGQNIWAQDGTEGNPWVVSSWADLKTKMAEGGYILLDADVSDPTKSSSSYLNVPSGVTVTLNLNGHTIDRALTATTSDGYVINVAGSLTVNDSSNPSTGSITGGWNKSGYGAGIHVSSDATLILNNGSITGNKNEKASGEAKGGGVYVGLRATFTMNGGSITNNSVSTSNSSAIGGGVYVHSYDSGAGTFNMNGGVITGNSVISNGGNAAGGGVLYNNGAYLGNFNLQGNCTITGNTGNAGEADNVYVVRSIHLSGALDTETRIGITASAETQIVSYEGSSFSDYGSLDNFTCDKTGFDLQLYNGIRIITVGVFVAAHASTCTDTGISQDCWLKDGHYYSDQECTNEINPVTPPLGHDMIHHPALAPTATTNGNVEYWECSRCGKFFLDANGDTETSAHDIIVGPTVNYIDADGQEKSVSAHILTGSETSLYEGWYIVVADISYDHYILLSSENVRIILADGATMSIGSSGTPLSNDECIDYISSATILSIYGQAGGTGAMNLYSNHFAINVPTIYIYGGQITASCVANDLAGIRSMYNVNIYGGNVTSIGARGISSNIINLGWMNTADRITSTATATNGESYYLSIGGAVSVKDGQYLYNGTEVLSGTIADLTKLQNVTLQPAVKITLPEGVTASGTNVFNQTDGTYALPGATVSLAADREGYTFGGYSSNDVTITAGSFETPAANVTIEATWWSNTLNLTANAATLSSLARNWCTFYHPSLNYSLPYGAQAFTMKSDKGLYLVGDGSVIPADTPVVIMSDAAAITLTKIDATTVAAESGNILRGTAVETLRTGLITGSEKVYVLGKIGDVFGFYEYTGDEIPANKAYYVE